MVVAVVALAAMVVVPRVGVVRGVVVEVAARRLADGIAFARERAILGGTTMRLLVDIDGGRWQVGRPGREPGTLAPAGDEAPPLGRATPLPAGVHMRGVAVGGALPVRAGTVALDLRPDGDALPVRIDLSDGRGHVATVAVPPARARPLVLAGEPS